MKLISLELREWRAYEEEFIEFPDGLVGVAGPNGAGKSTIAEAVGWTLFGKLRKGQKQGSLRRQGGDGRATAELKFRMGDAIYTVRRVAGGDCTLWIGDSDDDPEATGARNVNARIARELELTWDVFRRTVFAEQKDIAALDPATTGPARRAHVERLLGLTRYKVAAESARRDARAIENEVTGRLAQVADPDVLMQELSEAERGAEAESPNVANAKTELDKAQKNYADARTKAQDEQKRVTLAANLDARRDKAGELAAIVEGRVTETRGAIEERDARLVRLRAIESEAARAADAERTSTLWQALAEAEESLRSAQTEVDELGYDARTAERHEQTLEKLERERAELETAQTKLQREVEQVRQRVVVLEEAKAVGQVEPLKQRVTKIAAEERQTQKRLAITRARLDEDHAHVGAVEEGGPETPCPVCKKPYGDEHEAILRSYRDRIAAAEAELPALEREATQQAAELDNAREAISRAREVEKALERTEGPATLSGAKTALERAEQKLQKTVERREVVDDELPSLRTQVRVAAKAAQQWSAKTELARDRQEKRQTALAVLAVKRYSERAHMSARDAADQLRKVAHEAEDLRRRIADTAGLEKELQAQIAQAEEQREVEKSARENLKGLGAVPGKIEKLQTALDRLQEICQLAEEERDRRREAFGTAKEEARDRSEEVKRLRAELKAAEKAHDEIANRAADQRRHQVAAEILEAYRAHEARRAWPRLEISAAELLSAATDGRYADVRLSEQDFQLTIADRGEHHELGRYSGGEQDLANLCLRLAIAEWVANERGVDLSLLILDEVFGSQDDERRQRLLDQLRNLSRRFGQMLIITHVPEVAEMCDSRIDVRLKDEGTSEAVVAV